MNDGYYESVEEGDVWNEITTRRELARHGFDLRDLLLDMGCDARLDRNKYDANAVVAWLGY